MMIKEIRPSYLELFYSTIDACSKDDLSLMQKNRDMTREMLLLAESPADSQKIDCWRWTIEHYIINYFICHEYFDSAVQMIQKIQTEHEQMQRESPANTVESSISYIADHLILYNLGLCKWLAGPELRDLVWSPEEMLQTWLRSANWVLGNGVGSNDNDKNRIHGSGQTVIQAGLRYCPTEVEKAINLYNQTFGTMLNTRLRDYLDNEKAEQGDYLYWSIELVKAMYSGSLTLAEFDYLNGREMELLLDDSNNFKDYAISRNKHYVRIIKRRYGLV